ncbi:hypothetical protein HMPREF0666_03277, partial [Prevotella sp. C561]|uniref:hypothetical protein n=1 Tax=Prevotella sp. C561 TaxID=563031 RepID=UPI0002237552
GSSTVLADEVLVQRSSIQPFSCSTFGFAPPPRLHPGKFKKPSVSRFLPTQLLSIITSGGNPVLVGGPPTIDLFQLAMKMGLKCLTKTKAYQKLSEAFEKTPLGKINKK